MGRTEAGSQGGQGQSESMGRREFNTKAAALGALRVVGRGIRYASWRIPAAAAALDQEISDKLKPNSNLVISPEQREKFRSEEFEKNRNIVLVIGGATVQNSDEIANAVAPGFAGQGPVVAIDWGHEGFDMQGVTKNLLDLKEEYGIINLIMYFHSMGDIEGGALMPLIKNDFHVPLMIFDDSINDLSDTKIVESVVIARSLPDGQVLGVAAEVGKIVTDILPFSPLGNLGTRLLVALPYYGTPFAKDFSSDEIAWGQLRYADHGTDYLKPLAEKAEEDGSLTFLLQPEKPQSNPVTDDIRAAQRLKQDFRNLKLFKLTGDAGHADDIQEPGPYRKALLELFDENREALEQQYQAGLALAA